MQSELLKRYDGNPILTFRDVPFHANAVYNPGATKAGDEYILVPRVEDGRRDNRLHVARSSDGIRFTIDPDPIEIPGTDEERAWEKHHYDARVTRLEGAYYLAYCAQTMQEVVRIGLARTHDFKSFERLAFPTEPWSRNCALFPEKVGGLYARLDRPMNGNDAMTFITFSPDLEFWGKSRLLDLKVETWMREKWGIGPPPIRTEEGWLLIIHGVWLATNYVYRLGVVLLDLEEPWKVVGQCPEFIFTPREPYERSGEVPNCVFSNGAVVEPDGSIKVYYGAADTCIGLATGRVDELVAACKNG